MKSRIMVFDHGRLGQPFIVRPKGGSYSTGSCVSYGDEVFLAISTQSYNTRNCGQYGCAVLLYVANSLGIIRHGKHADETGGIYFIQGDRSDTVLSSNKVLTQ